MKYIRQLTSEDTNLLPAYLGIFNSRLNDISSTYTSQQIEEIRKNNNIANLEKSLREGSEKQFRAHFTDKVLDGILIEGERESHVEGKRESLVYWIMAEQDGKGIGSEMLGNCIKRAKKSGKAFVYLSVAEKNPAKIFYQKKGFIEERRYGENNNMCLMVYPIEENLGE